MSNKKTKVVAVALVLLAIVTGCVIGSSKADAKGVSGTVNVAGSSALLPLVQSAAKSFMDANQTAWLTPTVVGPARGCSRSLTGRLISVTLTCLPMKS